MSIERQTFDDAIDWLSKCFSFPLSYERRQFYWVRFRNEDDTIFLNVMMDEIPKNLNTFPTPEKISEFLSAAREKKYQKEKIEELVNREPITDMPVRSRHAAGFKHLLIKALNDERNIESRTRLLEEMEAMDEKHPGCGWAEAAAEHKKFLQDRKLLD